MRSAIYVKTSTLTHSQQHSIEEQIERLRTNLLSCRAQAADEHVFRDEGTHPPVSRGQRRLA